MKTLPINRNRTLFTTSDSPQEQSNQIPITMQRRSSFQEATKLNSLDFYTTSEPFYFLDKQFIKPIQRNHYSPEREKRRDYSKIDPHRPNPLIVENHMLTNEYLDRTNSYNDQSIHEMNSNNRDSLEDNKNFILNHENRYRDDGIFV
jgi:hypothetical protein